MENLQISDALQAISELVRVANKYIEDQQPWALARKPELRARLNTVLYNLAEVCRVLSVLLTPFFVETPQKIRQQLGLDLPVQEFREAVFGGFPKGMRVRRGQPLFPRVEPTKTEPEWITLDDFQKIDLRVGTIRHAEIVSGADRLLKLTVFDGERERTIVSGIRATYQPEDLIDKQVVLVANLKPVKLRGILSEGMLLAGSAEGTLSIVAPISPLAEGARVK
jgi:methionyl-tRNA synthetase